VESGHSTWANVGFPQNRTFIGGETAQFERLLTAIRSQPFRNACNPESLLATSTKRIAGADIYLELHVLELRGDTTKLGCTP